MSNYFEYNDKIAFHPGYYIKEIVDGSGLTQEDFAKRLDTTPKNLSLLIRGEQSLSCDIAMKLSRMLGTSVSYWLNLQSTYDALLAEYKSELELQQEKRIFDYLDYKYFRDEFNLPDLPRQPKAQIVQMRNFLGTASLTVFGKRDMAVSFRSETSELSERNIVKANVMVQIATNMALTKSAPKYNRALFQKAVQYALSLTKNHSEFYPLLEKAFFDAGVVFIILPNLSGSKINGATKKIGHSIMLMVNDRRLNSDTFWFSLFHEIGHILRGDYGISFEEENGTKEEEADIFAENMLIPREKYELFLVKNRFDSQAIISFAESIDRDPGIVLGRLLNDGKVKYSDTSLYSLRHKYKITPTFN